MTQEQDGTFGAYLDALIALSFCILPVLPVWPSAFFYLVYHLRLSSSAAWGLLAITGDIVNIALISAFVRFWEDRKLSFIGWRAPSSLDITIGIGGFFLSIWVTAGWHRLVSVTSWNSAPSAQLATRSAQQALRDWPRGLRVIWSITGPVAEEVLFRGSAIEHLSSVIGIRWVAALAAYLLCLVAHIPYWGAENVIGLMAGEFVFMLLYLGRRNLVPGIIAHVAADLYVEGLI